MEDLIQALRRELGDALLLGRPAVEVNRDLDGWQVRLGGEVETMITAKELTLAVPAHAAAMLLARVDQDLANELSAIAFAPVANVYLGFWESDVAAALQGFGFLLDPIEDSPVLGILYCSSIFPRCSVPGKFLVRAMIGGRDHPETVDLGDEELINMVRETLRKYAGIKDSPLFQRVRRADKAVPQFEIGHFDRVQRIRTLASRHPNLTLRGNSYDEVSIVGQMTP